MPHKTQGPHLTPPSSPHLIPTSSPQVMMVDKILVTSPPPILEEHVQKEPSLQGEPKPRVIDEPSKEAQVVECIQQPLQEVEDQTTGSTKIETTEEESSQ